MDTPRTSSNGLIMAVLACLCVCNLSSKLLASDPFSVPAQPVPGPIVVVSRQIEPYFRDLFSDLDLGRPFDLIPQIELARDRFAERQAGAEPGKRAIYAQATKLLDGMLVVAKERNESLKVLLDKAGKYGSKLELADGMKSSSQYFLDRDAGRANLSLQRKKPALEDLLVRIKAAEREWNARYPGDAGFEIYGIRKLAPSLVIVEKKSGQTALDRKPYDRRDQP